MSRYRRAISPVIATVILVAVTIAISISAAYWMSGTSGQYTGFEKIEILTAYSTLNPTVNNAKWRIHLSLKNSGPNPANIVYVMVRARASGTGSIGTSISDKGVFLQSGETVDVYVWIGSGLFSSGTSIAVKLHSTSGFDYVKLVQLS